MVDYVIITCVFISVIELSYNDKAYKGNNHHKHIIPTNILYFSNVATFYFVCALTIYSFVIFYCS